MSCSDKSPHLPAGHWTPREGFEAIIHLHTKGFGVEMGGPRVFWKVWG